MAKDEDGPYSDLEMLAVLREPLSTEQEIMYQEFISEGLCIEVDFTTPEQFWKRVARVDDDWAIETDENRNHLVIFDHDGILAKAAEISMAVLRPYSHGLFASRPLCWVRKWARLSMPWNEATRLLSV